MYGIYSYFGRFDDHEQEIPGHPLYQMYFIESICQKFGIQKLYPYYYNKDTHYIPYTFSVQKKIRNEIAYKYLFGEIGIKDIYNLILNNTVLNSNIFLKYRFRNFSRLSSSSFDRYKFEEIYKWTNGKAVIIDTDDEIQEEYSDIISLFINDKKYPGNPRIHKIIPVLEHRAKLFERRDRKYNNLTFIGNEYFKEGIHQTFQEINKRTGIKIITQGKWKKHGFLHKTVRREFRLLGYEYLTSSLCTIQMSKDSYRDYEFMSPRIFEAMLLGTICFSQNKFVAPFMYFSGVNELVEKIKYLQNISIEEYYSILERCISQTYENIRYMINE